ncbi:circularly permuted type 2 ATP-grasp protein [Vineibacter terrae]|uniref:circularly permuted type 2 ATP-grasp protein n=1 Tax=Vineibacter terrae TaxID=2586908 RepID=UPI002E32D378|nr:circularly permuted type 2 ATP-grasp protein [Vineibacter terrae]HEX2885327.1 circularly permuted type 2 ATP-grasp protein [Vineibacter terrae]
MKALRIPEASPGKAAYDELVTGQGTIRYHWQGLLSVVRSLPDGGFAGRVERARQQLVEGGATGVATPDGASPVEAWALEGLPLIVSPSDWRVLEDGLAQRARLLDALLADVYGPQRLLAERVLPPALLQANPHFLRPCHSPGATPPKRHLVTYAADVVHMPDGSWAVLADHTQAPAGGGYALHIRRTLARALPEAFRAVAVREIGPFYEQWRETLAELAPDGGGNPLVALLTAGPYAQTYVEQVFLARALGMTLVEGADLTVRTEGVALKTLEGLKHVDVLLRRLDSAYCDPLELRADSTLGVTGLLGAARSGSVTVANALGSGAIETPALAPFLPGLARRLLGEELQLPAVDVWWLGEKPALDHALAQFDSLVFRPAFDAAHAATAATAIVGSDPRALYDRVRARPADWVAQHRLAPSMAPSWTADGLRPEPLVLRLFAIARDDGYMVMPGGVARTPAADPLTQPGRLDGQLRDIWVLAEDDADVVIPSTARFQRLAIQRGVDLQSRIADNLFWLGRYTERLDNTARLIRAALSRLALGPMGPRDQAELRQLTRALADMGLISASEAMAPPDSVLLIQTLTRFTGDGRPIAEILRAIKRLAASTRDRLSADMIATLDALLGAVTRRLAQARGDVDRLLAALGDLIRFVATFAGLSQENVTRGSGWRFLDIGRRLERAYFTCRGVLSPFTQTPMVWESAMRLALELCDSTITYRTRYLGALEPAPTLDLVLLDDSNPRAVAFQLHAIHHHLDELGRATGSEVAFPAAQHVGALHDAVMLFARDERAWRHEGLALAQLRHALDRLETGLGQLSDELTRHYFSLVPAAHALGQPTA